ncbi:hypothetical protein MUN81_11410 [Hymenobacter sp. 5317J-9]|uniref:TapB family protein n=1 Tax=Hymenobacter sp. 5317J-9 TaxID=2932250 RepID=UPI001FD6709D|nr:hypothetical protein [Hymenobacter sp. 5317J-9]UOQ95873.1 hypothetical protein MUN81_11410 [Hymenobacter sp. 5317J-9]
MNHLLSGPTRIVACLLFNLLAVPGPAQPSHDSLLAPASADLSLLSFQKVSAVSCAYPFGLHEGQNLEYQLLDAKGKPTAIWRYRVLKISTDSTIKKKKPVVSTTVRLKSGLYDLSNHVQQQQDVSILCRRDTTYTDGLAEINYDGLKSFRERLKSYSGTPVAWPNSPTVGSSLPKGGVVIQVSSPSVAIAKVSTTVRDRKVTAAPAPVTVPAGTFQCFAVESQRELATAARADLILKSAGRQVDYYDPAVGVVKTEYYDKNGKLSYSKVLSKH